MGRPFTVESDHKPLEMIHQKSHIATGGDIAEANRLTGRKKTK